jgi:type I restriction enzyme S subunit
MNYILCDGELVFARTGASVGKSYLYDPRDGNLVYAGFLINIAPDPKRLNPKYLSLFAQTKVYWDWIARTSVRSGQPGVNGREYAQLQILLPDIATQDRIVATMTDVDQLISTLERLIKKKEAIKQGMMQELLTGRTRLPGFVKTWVEGPLKSFMPLQRGFDLPTTAVIPGPYPVVYSNGVVRTHVAAMTKGPGVVTGRSGTLGKVHYIAEDYWPHNTTLWVTDFSRVDSKFAYYFLIYLGLERFASGSGVPTLNRNDAHSFDICLPMDKVEQIALAEALCSVDKEIAQLERRLVKARAIKQGMMQQLLTGQIRLPVAEVAT